MLTNITLAVAVILELCGLKQPTLSLPKNPQSASFADQNVSQTTNQNSQSAINLTNLTEDIVQINPLPEQKSNTAFETSAQDAILIDLKTNKILYQKNAHEAHPIASLSKLMTAIVVLESGRTNEEAIVSDRAASAPQSDMGLVAGEHIKVIDLVNGMMIASANDAAWALEDYFGKDKLVSMMNDKVKWLGLTDTQYFGASGLESNNVSSVQDLAWISSYALKKNVIHTDAQTKTLTVYSTDGKTKHDLSTTNRLLKNYPDIFGLKTGYTDEAGNCLIAGASDDGHQVLSVVLGVKDGDARFSESRSLLDWAFNNWRW